MSGAPKGLFIKTYGCQMNVYDSERMRDVLKPLGYAPVDAPDDADLVVLNTCHIREKATEKTFSELGKLKRMKEAGGGRDAHCRCRLRRAGRGRRDHAAAAGRRSCRRPAILSPAAGDDRPHCAPDRRTARNGFCGRGKIRRACRARAPDGPSAFLSVQEGCDKFCTFCVVPYTRGAEFSRGADAIVAEARELARQGVKEIVLIGQNVNAWHGAPPAGDDAQHMGPRRSHPPHFADRRRRTHPLHDLPSARHGRQPCRRSRARSSSLRPSCICPCNRAQTAFSRR